MDRMTRIALPLVREMQPRRWYKAMTNEDEETISFGEMLWRALRVVAAEVRGLIERDNLWIRLTEKGAALGEKWKDNDRG